MSILPVLICGTFYTGTIILPVLFCGPFVPVRSSYRYYHSTGPILWTLCTGTFILPVLLLWTFYTGTFILPVRSSYFVDPLYRYVHPTGTIILPFLFYEPFISVRSSYRYVHSTGPILVT